MVNLGSPDSCSTHHVRKYLQEFLNDPYVIDLPRPIRSFLVNGIILNTRPKKSAEAYAKIWTENGSPLVFHTQDLTHKIKKRFHFPVEFGMRYGNPSIQSGVQKLIAAGAKNIICLPLYPQYSYAASETALVEFEKVITQYEGRVAHQFIEDFYDHPVYMHALAESIRQPLQTMIPDLLLLSYHGIPIRQTTKTRNKKNYQEQCIQTTKLLQKELGLQDDQIMTTFQSRLGPVKWIEPYTDVVLPQLVKQGKKRILVASPSFTADCLETLEEIKLRYSELFLESGGKEFEYVPCLNSSDSFVSALVEIISSRSELQNG